MLFRSNNPVRPPRADVSRAMFWLVSVVGGVVCWVLIVLTIVICVRLSS
jgi:hypothetical protein